MEGTVQIRAACRQDVPGILDIFNDAVLHSTGTYEEQPHTLAQRMEWFEQCAAKHYPICVAADADGRVLGWGALSPFCERPGFRHTAVCATYVATTCRRNGIGTRLLEALLVAAKARGVHTILAAVDEDNAASLRLHEKAGFAVAGHFREIGHKDGRWHDVRYLQRMM